MKSKADISLEIMRRVVAYEKKKLRMWYEVVIFVVAVMLVSEMWVAFDLVLRIQERPEIDFWWILKEDMETTWVLLWPVAIILWEELPWIKIGTLMVVSGGLLGCLWYVWKRKTNKRVKARQIKTFESLK